MRMPWGEGGYWSADEKREMERSVVSGLITGLVIWVLIRRGLDRKVR